MQREIGMADTVGDFILRRLTDWGVQRIFGYPGDGISGLMGALDRANPRFDYVRVRHEEMSAFMAGGHAQFVREVGVFLATPRPGALAFLVGLFLAKGGPVPVVATFRQQSPLPLWQI